VLASSAGTNSHPDWKGGDLFSIYALLQRHDGKPGPRQLMSGNGSRADEMMRRGGMNLSCNDEAMKGYGC
jgi:hypothetical protein